MLIIIIVCAYYKVATPTAERNRPLPAHENGEGERVAGAEGGDAIFVLSIVMISVVITSL